MSCCVRVGKVVLRQAQCAVKEQPESEGTGLRRPSPAEWISLPDWEGKLARGAQRCLLDSFVSTASLLTRHRTPPATSLNKSKNMRIYYEMFEQNQSYKSR